MGLSASIRQVVRKARPVVYRIPLVGKGLRYLKRAITLPWNFHKHYQASGEYRVQQHATLHSHLHTQQAFLCEALQAQTEVLAAHLANVMRDTLPALVTEHLQQSVSAPVQRMVTDFRLGLAEMAGELRSLNDRHAACYDRLAEQLRRQTDHIRALADAQAAGGAEDLAQQLTDLAAAQEDLTRQLGEVRAEVGEAATSRLRLSA